MTNTETTTRPLLRGDRVRHARFTEMEGTVLHYSQRHDDATIRWDGGGERYGYTAAELERTPALRAEAGL